MQKLRGTVIEGIIGQAKTYHGMEKTRFRGLAKVQIQFLLTATALNLKKMVRTMYIKEMESRIFNNILVFIQTIRSIFINWLGEIAFQVT